MAETVLTVGHRVQHLRLEAGLSKSALAKKIEVSDVSVGYWEKGTSKTINHLLLMRLAEALDVTVSELVGDPHLPAHDAALLIRHADALDRMAERGEGASALAQAANYLRDEARKLHDTSQESGA